MMKDVLVYKYPASHAQEHDELNAYRASNKANMACKEAIEAAIRDHYRDNRLGSDAVKQVVEQFGYDRVFHVLAVTVQQKDWDGGEDIFLDLFDVVPKFLRLNINGKSRAKNIFLYNSRPGVKFCVSDFRQSQEWRWKTGQILAWIP